MEVIAHEAPIVSRPWPSQLEGTAEHGARLGVRGLVVRSLRHRPQETWYAVAPLGFVDAKLVQPVAAPPASPPSLPVRYLQVISEQRLPLYPSRAELEQAAPPERLLGRGDTLVAASAFSWHDHDYWLSLDRKVLPQAGTVEIHEPSQWQGLLLRPADRLPFGWATSDGTPTFRRPGDPTPIARLARRERVRIVGERKLGAKRWLRIATGGWVDGEAIAEVRRVERPRTGQWIDVDVAEQVLVAYAGARPSFATLISSGRDGTTPLGVYPIWAKARSITMKSQPYDKTTYFADRVPWALFFQWHNALHGAYWHDRFGQEKTRGCINLAPFDARWLFEWIAPPLPLGWDGLQRRDLDRSPVVVVRDSRRKGPLPQDRPIGPPQPAVERRLIEEAAVKR